MNEHQFQHVLKNRRRWDARPLFAGADSERLLRNAAERMRQRRELEEAWQKTADPRWLPHTRVAGVRERVLTILVEDAVLLHQLTRQARKLQNDMERCCRRFEKIEFRPAKCEVERCAFERRHPEYRTEQRPAG